MSLKLRIDEERTAARVHEYAKYNILTMVKAAIQVEEKKDGKEISDEAIITVIRRQIKQLKEANEEISKATEPTASQRQAVAENITQITILEGYVPKLMDEEEVKIIVFNTITSLGLTADTLVSSRGKIIGKLMPSLKGKADGKLVAKIVDDFIKGA